MLPANAMRLFQPLDVSVFAPIKSTWRKELENWQQESRVVSLPKEHFPLHLKRMYNACLDTFPKNLENGFRTCGLYPLNRNEVLRELRKTISNVQADQSMNETFVSLLEQNCGHRKGGAKTFRGKRVQAGVIANMEPPDSVESSEE